MKSIISVLLLLIIVGVSPVLAWQVNEHYTNNTGQNAYDLTKFIFGPNLSFTDVMLNQPYPDFEQTNYGSFTIGHWYDNTDNAFVAPGDQGHACFGTNAPTAPPYIAYWTDIDGNFIGIAGPVMTYHIGYDAGSGQVLIKIGNEWHYWTGTGYPPQPGDELGTYVGEVTVPEVKYAIDSAGLPWVLEDLDSTILTDPNLFFADIPGLTGTYAGGDELMQWLDPGIPLEYGQKIVLFFTAEGPGGENAYDVIVWEYKPQVPSLTNWGIIILITLLVLSTIYVVYRRRRLARQ
jgi:hypothetical protein